MSDDLGRWTPEVLDQILEGTWVARHDFRAGPIVTSRKEPQDSALFIGYSDETFRKYMGGANYVYFGRSGRRFGNLKAAREAAGEGWVSALVVERELPVEIPQLIVEDAFAALEDLASYRRSLITAPVIAVTGTVGKSSTIRALRTILGREARRLAPSNVRKGLALGTANAPLDTPGSPFFAEVSISALWGEDGGAANFLRPDIALLTEVGLGMTHRVPTEQDTAVEKMNLINEMSPDGVFLFNTDMKFASYAHQRAQQQPVRSLGYGTEPSADYRILGTDLVPQRNGDLWQEITLQTSGEEFTLTVPAIGKAHAYANVAALAVADTLGISRDDAVARIARYTPSKTSEQIYGVSETSSGDRHTIVDGTFSATPLSMRNSFDLAAEVHRSRHHGTGDFVAVLSRIVALEDQSESAHAELAEPLAQAGVDRVYTYGPDLSELVDELSRRGLHAGHYESIDDLVKDMTASLRPGSTILLKGSKRASDFREVRTRLDSYFGREELSRSITVTGTVQGVGYRRWVKGQAESYGLFGWSRNAGSDVELFVQGQRPAVEEFVEVLSQGPTRAAVEAVHVEEAEPQQLTRFRTRASVSTSETSASDTPSEEPSGDGPTWPERYTAEVVEQAFGSQKLSSFCLALEAWRRGLRVSFSSPAGVRFSVSDGQKDVSFNGSRSSLTTRSAIRTVDDKNATLQRLQKAGVPTPKSRMFDMSAAEVTELITCAETEYRWPVVVKPVSGSRGDGVFANISTTDELRSCLQHITHELGATRVLLEEHARGDDFRIYVVGETVAAACQRVPANVIGDGRSSVKALIRAKNAERRKNPFLSKGLIKVDVEIESMLHRQSLGLDDIPEDGRYVQLRQKANASAGGDVVDVTDSLPEEVKQAAATAVKAVPGLEAAGVDVLLDMDADSPGDAFVVIELNARAHIGVNMYPTVGSGVDVPSVLLDHFFPETVGLNNRAADTAVFDLNTVLKPLQIGSAEDVTVKQMPQTAYPSRRCVEFDEAVRLTDRTAARLRRASRISGAVGAFEFSSDHARLIVCGEQEHVQDFLRRAQQILGRDLTEITPWNGLVVNGFQVRRIAEPTGRNA